jgi:hypothetical protein
MTKGVLALLGSGETAPGMTKVHRELLARLENVRAVNIDTAYAFQENVPEMTEKLVSYFQTSLHISLEPLHFASYDTSDDLTRSIFKQQVRDANFVFAGPGSPSYAVQHWLPLDIVSDLQQVLANDGTLCFSSAAVATLGAFSPPVYEIYKVGSAPYWNPGLNLLANYGLDCVVIPHFDNAEGSNYDTSCCYLGKRRLELMERELPSGTATLGVDEHTALIFDFGNDTLRVLGRSNGYWRENGHEMTLKNGSTTALADLRTRPETPPLASRPIEVSHEVGPEALARVASGQGPDAIEALGKLVLLSKTGGEGYIDPTSLIDGILKVRENARKAGQYGIADELRDAIIQSGIDVQDGPNGSSWVRNSTN